MQTEIKKKHQADVLKAFAIAIVVVAVNLGVMFQLDKRKAQAGGDQAEATTVVAAQKTEERRVEAVRLSQLQQEAEKVKAKPKAVGRIAQLGEGLVPQLLVKVSYPDSYKEGMTVAQAIDVLDKNKFGLGQNGDATARLNETLNTLATRYKTTPDQVAHFGVTVNMKMVEFGVSEAYTVTLEKVAAVDLGKVPKGIPDNEKLYGWLLAVYASERINGKPAWQVGRTMSQIAKEEGFVGLHNQYMPVKTDITKDSPPPLPAKSSAAPRRNAQPKGFTAGYKLVAIDAGRGGHRDPAKVALAENLIAQVSARYEMKEMDVADLLVSGNQAMTAGGDVEQTLLQTLEDMSRIGGPRGNAVHFGAILGVYTDYRRAGQSRGEAVNHLMDQVRL